MAEADHRPTTTTKETNNDPYAFENLKEPRPLSKGVLQYTQSQHFTRMTPVQAATLPQFLNHKDVAVQAVTGSGKTLAFLIPILEILQQKKYQATQIGALILAPTRELARQTYTVAKDLCACCSQPEPLLLVGGGSSSSANSSNARPVTADLHNFQTLQSNLVIGTPGRVQDILSRYRVLDTTELDCLILDEADVLLNMGFCTTLQEILTHLPKMRRTALFSATTSSSSLREWMHRVGMRNPVWIDVTVTASSSSSKVEKDSPTNDTTATHHREQATPSSLANFYMVTPLDEKLSRLVAFLKQHQDEKVIVFLLTCACVEFFGKSLQQLGLSVELLHGRMVQKRREKTMEKFRQTGNVLFCTDVAARGLDVLNVQWVIQVDAPQDPSFFVHRVGRCARAGAVGNSLLFLTEKEEAYVDFLQMRKVPIEPLGTTEHCSRPETENQRLQSAAGKDVVIEDVLPKIRQIVMQDREMLEKGTKAFTSYIRAYKEHHCAFIFRYVGSPLFASAILLCIELPADATKGELKWFIA